MQEFSPFWLKLAISSGPQLPRIAFSDATDPRILQAVKIIIGKRLAFPVLVGRRDEVLKAAQKANVELSNPDYIADINKTTRDQMVDLLLKKQTNRNISREEVSRQLEDPIYQGIGLLLNSLVDGLVAGATRPTADVVRAAIQCIGPRSHRRLISGHFLIEAKERKASGQTPFLFADCAVIPEPSSRALAAVAVAAAESFRFFTGQTPRVALLSFSTRDSAKHELVDRVKEAVLLAKKEDDQLIVDGELQVDAALDWDVAVFKKAGDSPVAGQANVLVFPTLEAGNIGYKLVQRFSDSRIAGPLLWGLDKPVSDLSRGCTVQEITDTALCVCAMVRGLS